MTEGQFVAASLGTVILALVVGTEHGAAAGWTVIGGVLLGGAIFSMALGYVNDTRGDEG